MEQKNKVFGAAFIHDHFYSRRWTVRYNPKTDCVDLFKYDYDFFKHSEEELPSKSIKIGDEIELEVILPIWWLFSIECFFYFGGKEPAPFDINLSISGTKLTFF